MRKRSVRQLPERALRRSGRRQEHEPVLALLAATAQNTPEGPVELALDRLRLVDEDQDVVAVHPLERRGLVRRPRHRCPIRGKIDLCLIHLPAPRANHLRPRRPYPYFAPQLLLQLRRRSCRRYDLGPTWTIERRREDVEEPQHQQRCRRRLADAVRTAQGIPPRLRHAVEELYLIGLSVQAQLTGRELLPTPLVRVWRLGVKPRPQLTLRPILRRLDVD